MTHHLSRGANTASARPKLAASIPVASAVSSTMRFGKVGSFRRVTIIMLRIARALKAKRFWFWNGGRAEDTKFVGQIQ
jgi:hypothetical protein